MPCTTLLVGKYASYNGSTLMARNEDAASNAFMPKKLIIVNPEDQPRHYTSVLSSFTIDLPDNPMRYSAMPNAIDVKGIWGEVGFNTDNICMSETETITSNSRVLGADPLLIKEGIGEEDLLTIVLPYIHSAKEGVLRLGNLLETYGTYEMNGIGFQDENEIWWFESIGGHHWIAKRVPDDTYVVMPNQQGIDSFDMVDAFNKQENHMCSKDLISFIENNNLDVTFNTTPLKDRKNVDVRAIFGSHSDSDHSYNTPRAWYMLRYFNPNTFTGNPEDDNLPWSMIPEHKISIEDIKYVLSSYYQGTEFNPYGKYGYKENQGKYRPIGINRNNFVAISELRRNVPKEIQAVEWIAEGCNAFNSLVPFYANVTKTPEYLNNTTENVTTNNFYWTNRIIGALTDAHYNVCIAEVEKYKLHTIAKGHTYLKEFDNAYMKNPKEDVQVYLENCNQIMCDYIEQETNKLLNIVLELASFEMKNKYSKNDA